MSSASPNRPIGVRARIFWAARGGSLLKCLPQHRRVPMHPGAIAFPLTPPPGESSVASVLAPCRGTRSSPPNTRPPAESPKSDAIEAVNKIYRPAPPSLSIPGPTAATSACAALTTRVCNTDGDPRPATSRPPASSNESPRCSRRMPKSVPPAAASARFNQLPRAIHLRDIVGDERRLVGAEFLHRAQVNSASRRPTSTTSPPPPRRNTAPSPRPNPLPPPVIRATSHRVETTRSFHLRVTIPENHSKAPTPGSEVLRRPGFFTSRPAPHRKRRRVLMFIHDKIFAMAERFRFARLARRDANNHYQQVRRGCSQINSPDKHAARIEIHVFVHRGTSRCCR